jgi:hypothetical protein
MPLGQDEGVQVTVEEDRGRGTMVSTVHRAAPMAGGEGPAMVMGVATMQAEVHLHPLQAGWEHRDRDRA